MTSPAASPTNPLATSLAALLIALAIVVAWSGSLDGPFVLDDVQNITSNETLRDFWNLRRVLSPPADSSVGGRPLLNFSFAVNHAIGGTSVRGYHIVNLAIHIAAALTLFGLVRRTLVTEPLRARFGAVALPLAAVAALVWALHPLQTASVTYVSQRAESLMGLFYLLVLYSVARGWIAAAIVSCACGVFTKEVIVTAPLVALLYDRTFLAGSFRGAWRQRRALYLGLVAVCSLLAWTMSGIQTRGVAADEATGPLRYAWIECRVVADYLRLIVWPQPLVFDYGQFEDAPGASLIGALVLAPLLVATGFALVRRPVLGFVGAWFFVILAPTSSVVPVTYQPMGENRVYLPMAALVAAAVVGGYALRPRRWLPQWIALAAAFAALTALRNADYRDPVALWAKTLALRPDNFRAQNEYAISLGLAGRADDAVASMQKALARRPEASTLQRNLALLLMRKGDTAAALPHFAAVVRLEPNFVKGRQEYARALAAAGRLPEAIEQVQAGARLVPQSAGPRLELANLLLQSHRPDDALAEFAAAVRLAPDDAEAHNEFAQTLCNVGRAREALPHFEAALRVEPDNADLHYNYGLALTQSDRGAAALVQFETAVRLKPDSPAAHFALANTLAGLGRLPEALPHYERTLQLDANFPQAREFYELARARAAR